MRSLTIVILASLVGLGSAVCGIPSTRQGYNCMVVANNMNFHWATDVNNGFMSMAIDVPLANSVGWAGVGWNTQPSVMIGSTAVVGTRTAAGAVTIGSYTLSAKVQATILATQSTPGWLSRTSITSESGRLIVAFRRVEVSTGTFNMVYAFGTSTSLTQHTASNRGTFQITADDGKPAVTIPTTPIPPTLSPNLVTPISCTPSTLTISGTSSTYACMLPLSSNVIVHWTTNTVSGLTSMAVTASGVTGWLGFSFPTVATSMFPAVAVASSSQIASVYQISSKSAAGIVPTVSDISNPTTEVVNGQRVIRFNKATASLTAQTAVNFAYHSTLTTFPSSQHTVRGSSLVNFATGTVTAVQLRDEDDARSHGGGMIAIWAYWIPLAIVIKVIGPLVCNCEVMGLPLPYVLHFSMMFIGMSLSTVFTVFAVAKFDNDVDYAHRELGIAILILGWVQVLFGLSKPDEATTRRKYWGWGHMLFGISVFVMAVFQMGFGIKNFGELYNNDGLRDDFRGALIGGLAGFGLVYLIARCYMCMRSMSSSESESGSDGSERAKDANI
eukprot:TRINITY_DN17414_c0_g1_i1.p1 TRINITY_DN17414_c0_g1~~TRINITY_DN17414_c0_g1_i1.p1  ORF type:complete len:556 (+),score=80.52 TRINITY_DN17414_c0_g1_i1:81-1748(+)